MAANVDIIIRAQNQASGAINQVQRELSLLGSAGATAERGLGGLQKAVGVGMAAATGAAVAGFAALGAGLAKSVNVAADFESQMNVLGVAARSSGTAVGALSEAALRVGSDTQLVGVSASEAADAMTNFYKAGLSTSDIFNDLNGYLGGTADLGGALRSAVDLAAASELDLAAASDTVAISMATFGLAAGDASRIANTLVQAADASLASVGGLSEALVNVGPVAASMGIELEEASTALAILSTRGIQGSEAGTALRSMLLNLQRPTKAVQSALDELGVSLFNTDGTMKALPTIIGSLETAMAGLTDEQRNQYATTLAGTYGLAAFQTLVGEGAAGWENMATAIGNAASAQQIAEARTKGFRAAMEQLWGSLEIFMISVGTPLLQVFLTPLAQALTNAVGELTKFAPSVADVERAFAQFLVTGQGVLTTISEFMAPIAEAVGSFVSWKDVLIVLAGVAASVVIPALIGIIAAAAPVIAVFAGLVAAVALVRTAWENNWGGIQEKTAAAFTAIQSAASSAWAAIPGYVTAAQATMSTAFTAIQTALVPVGEALASAQTAVGEFTSSGAWATASAEISTSLGTIGTAISGAFSGDISLSTLRDTLVTEATGIGTSLSEVFASEAFTKLSTDLLAAFNLTELPAQITAGVEAVKVAAQPLVDFLTPAFERIGTTVSGLGTYFTNIGTQIEPLKEAAISLGTAISGVFAGGEGGSPSTAAMWLQGALTLLAGAFDLVLNAVNGVAMAIAPIVSGVLAELTTVMSGLATIVSGVSEGIKGLVTGDTTAAWDGFKTALQGVADIITGTLTNAFTTISGVVTALGTTITTTLSDWGFDKAATAAQGVIDKITGLIDWLARLTSGEMDLSLTAPAWITSLTTWKWPTLPAAPAWVTSLVSWLWPSIPGAGWISSLLSWAWPSIPGAGWISSLLDWAWPDVPGAGWISDLLDWDWPNLPSLPSWMNFGGGDDTGNNAAGSGFWRGGATWVGESGRELVQLPRGSQIYSNRNSELMAAGMGGGNVTVYATVANTLDVQELAYRVADVLARG